METAISQPQTQPKQSFLKATWSRWLRFAEIIGTVQMVIVLTIIYWVMVTVMAIPFKLFADPLSTRRSHQVQWIKREPVDDDTLETMKNQF